MEDKKANIIVLYNELSEYFLVCLSTLCDLMGWNAVVISYPLKEEAPFVFHVSEHILLKNRQDYSRQSIEALIVKHDAQLIFVGGWFDGDYLKALARAKSTGVKLLGFDNAWNGSLKQILSAIYARFFIRPLFNIAFVPGESQKLFAEKLGFKDEEIVLGAYSADTEKFKSYQDEIQKHKKTKGVKRFLFLGRYVRHKGIFDLWEAFTRFRVEHQDWELWCVGAGDQYEHRIQGDGIKHFGFVQPNQLLPILKECDVYILPSHFEPWGVSVHEMAVAGFPMLLSDKIGAKEAFLKENENGKIFPSGDVQALFQAMCWVANQPASKLEEMGRSSHALGMRNTPQLWAEKLMHMLKTRKA